MGLLPGLLDAGFRQPASCLIEVGRGREGIGALADLVLSLELSVSRAEAATGTLVIEDRRGTDGRWMVADSGLFARWQPVRVSADFRTRVEEIFRGYMVELKPNYPPNGGEARIEITLQDEGAALDREHIRRVWGDDGAISDRDIVAELLKPAGLALARGSGEGKASRSLSQDATAIQFIRERAKASGYELIFAAGEVYFGPLRFEGQPQPPILVYAGKATNCLSFSVADDGQKPDAVRFDAAPREEGAQTRSVTVTPNLPLLGTTPVAQEGNGLGIPSVWRMSKEGDETEEEMRARAQALANDNSLKLSGTGELDGAIYGHVLGVGRLVSIDGVGPRYGGLWYVDKVSHAFSPDGYRQTLEVLRNATGESAAPGGLLSAASALSGLF